VAGEDENQYELVIIQIINTQKKKRKEEEKKRKTVGLPGQSLAGGEFDSGPSPQLDLRLRKGRAEWRGRKCGCKPLGGEW
jgi:hypothetical protein